MAVVFRCAFMSQHSSGSARRPPAFGLFDVRTFGGYRLDTATRQLLLGTSEIRLSPKEFALLQFLIENRPRAVSKSELHERLWPGTYVTDAALTVLIAELRTVLHDSADAPCLYQEVNLVAVLPRSTA
jgi:DNA-binding winged helix-turn-helix (wHTH) protein